MNDHEKLLQTIREASSGNSGSKTLLGPLPLLHSKQLEQELPRHRLHSGPRVWYQWIEKNQPRDRE